MAAEEAWGEKNGSWTRPRVRAGPGSERGAPMDVEHGTKQGDGELRTGYPTLTLPILYLGTPCALAKLME